MLAAACRQGAAWHEAGYPVRVAVNVSGRQLDSDTLVADVAAALAATGFSAGHLVVEITESVLMEDADATISRLHALKELGVRIAIDDFGTGYSSLTYIQRFPVDALKIDQSFVARLGLAHEDDALVRNMIQLGRAIGIEVIAEGIETEGQLLRLQAEHCDTGQGYYLARPGTPELAVGWFAPETALRP